MTDARTANWQRARDGARSTIEQAARDKLNRRVMKRALAEEQAHLRDLSSAELILHRLRLDIAAGLPPAALIERIDDELFKLTKKL